MPKMYKKGKKEDLSSLDPDHIHTGKLKNKKILFVDDDSVNIMLGKKILGKFQCRFDIAKNGKEAIAKLDTKTYDLILLDIRMPDISGIDVAKYLREVKKNKDCKIIAITAVALKDDIRKYHEAGINDFLIKPLREIYLYDKMCEILNLKSTNLSNPGIEIILKRELSPTPYNLSDLIKMANNDNVFVIQNLNIFLENTEEAITNFKHLLKEENWKGIGEVAHKILPSFKHLELNSIIPKLIEIKAKALITNDTEGISEIVTNITGEIEIILKDIRKELEILKELYQ